MAIGCKFEVGKTYKCTTGVIAKCLFAYEGKYYHGMIGEIISGGSVGDKQHFSGDVWSEYKEPRTVTRWVNVYDGRDGLCMGVTYASKEAAILYSSAGYIDTIPITYTEPH